jgi:hypothetical protein
MINLLNQTPHPAKITQTKVFPSKVIYITTDAEPLVMDRAYLINKINTKIGFGAELSRTFPPY